MTKLIFKQDQATESNSSRSIVVKKTHRFRAFIWRSFLVIASLPFWLWSAGFLFSLDDEFPRWVAIVLGMGIAIGFPVLQIWGFRRRSPIPFYFMFGLFGVLLIGYKLMTPRHDRDWEIAQATLPWSEQISKEDSDAELVQIHNIRTLRYGPNTPGRASHYDDIYDMSKIKSVWFGVDRFTEVKPLAHTFLSFEFESGLHRTNYLAFSVETRREKDEAIYSPIRGVFNNYELIYVIADEQDVLSVRSDVRQHVVQLYPVRANKSQARAMFLDMLERANGIRETPEFYHTLTSNCTNNLVYHANKILDNPISAWQRGVVFPGYSDWLAYQLGMLDTDLPLTEAREVFRIDQKTKSFDGRSSFSEFIRGR